MGGPGMIERKLSQKNLAKEQSNGSGTPKMAGRSTAEIDQLEDLELFMEEPEAEKKKREAKEAKERLKEYGGAVSVGKLFSLATSFELFVFILGVLCAIVHGAGQPMMCLMFGDLIDALSIPPGFDTNMMEGMNMEAMSSMDPAQAMAMMNVTGFDPAAAAMPEEKDFMTNLREIVFKFSMIGVAVFAVGSVQGAVFTWFAEQQIIKMRPIYFDAALHRDVGWFDTHDVAGLPSEMGSDLDAYYEGFGNKLGTSIMSVSCVIIGFGLGIYLSWQVGLMLCVAIPVMGAGGAFMGQAVMDMVSETQGAYVSAAKIINEVLFAVRTVVSFGGEWRELHRYAKEVEVARRSGVKTRVKLGLGMGYIWMSYFAAMALAFWFGMTLIYNGEDLSVGKMMSSFFCVLTAGFTIGQVPPGFTALHMARSTMARFFYIISHESEIQKRLGDSRKPMGPIESFRLVDVKFAYPARPTVPVLNGLNLTISKGQKVALVGESGSGKSTVMALLERFYDPLQGQVLVNGEDLRNFSVKSFRKQVGYVGQEPVLFTTTVRENIMQGFPEGTEEDLKRVASFAQLEFVEDLPEQFDTYVGSGGSQFSGGQKQRIAIARALLKKPSVLFLDEATSALDSRSEKMIQGTIDKIGSRSELGSITIVSIAHRLSTVKNSDLIYVLSGGAVVESGTHTELTAKEGGTYQALAAAQEMAGGEGEEVELQRRTSGASSNINNNNAGGSGEAQEEDALTALPTKKSLRALENAEHEEARTKDIAKKYKVPLSRLLSFCRPEWGYMVPGLLAALVSGACFPVLGAYILVDAMVAFLQPDKEAMKKDVEIAAIWFVACGGIKWVCTVLQFACFGVLGEAMTKRCRVAMLTTIFRQEMGFHDDPANTPGRLSKALQVYAFRIQVLCISIGETADGLCSVVVGMTLAFIACWEMALAMLIAIPAFGLSQGIQIAVMMGAAKKESAAAKTAQQVLSDALMNSRTVQAAGCEKDLLQLYRELLVPVSKGSTTKHLFTGVAFGLSMGIVFWICALGFWFMGFLIEEERTDFAEGQRAFMGVLYAAMGAGMAFGLTGSMTNAKVACHDMFQLLDRKSAINGLEPEGVKPKDGSLQVGRFEFENVRFYYPFRPDVQVLRGLSFTIERGQSVGVCGPSGGGKSTVMSLIQRFYDPQGGGVYIGQEGTLLSSVDIRWWRKQVGFVGQEPILFDTSVLENVKYCLDEGETVSQERLDECKRMAHLTFLDNHKAQGWDTQVGPRGARLSGGQKQRVAICRALVRNPPVLLLDEATSALDSQSEKVVSEALEAARQGRTSFAIAHRLSTIQDCDVILVVAEGVIVERGTHAELVEAKGVYHKLLSQSVGTKDVKPKSSK